MEAMACDDARASLDLLGCKITISEMRRITKTARLQLQLLPNNKQLHFSDKLVVSLLVCLFLNMHLSALSFRVHLQKEEV